MAMYRSAERPPPSRDVLKPHREARERLRLAPAGPSDAPNPLQLVEEGASLEWLGNMPKLEFENQNKLRQEKLINHDFTYRVVNQRHCPEAGHNLVNPRFAHKDPLAKSTVRTLASKVASRIFPDNTKWLTKIEFEGVDQEVPEPTDLPPPTPQQMMDPGYVESMRELTDQLRADKLEYEKRVLQAEAIGNVMWEYLQERHGELFDAFASRTIEAAAMTYGVVVRIASHKGKRAYGQEADMPCYTLYDFPNYVLDEGSRKGWEQSWIIFLESFDRAALKRLSQPEGERGPVFDPGQVAKVLGENREGLREPLASEVSATRQDENNGADAGDTPNRFDGFQYLGPLYRDGKLISENALVTCIGGICVQAIHNPEKEREWHLVGLLNARGGSIYPECLGFEIAYGVNKINLVETINAHAMACASFGMWQFDPANAAQTEKWLDSTVFGPGQLVPNNLKQVEARWSPEIVQYTYNRWKKSIEEVSGISEMDLANPGQADVTAQAQGNAQAGASSRQAAYAKHMTGPFLAILNSILNSIIENWQPIEVYIGGVKTLVTAQDVAGFKGRVGVASIGTSVIAPFQHQQKMQFVQILREEPSANQAEVTRFAVEGGVPAEALKKMLPEAPPPMPMQAPPQPMGQPTGQQPGNVVPMVRPQGGMQQ